MKTKRIKIKKTEVVGIYFVKRSPVIKWYSTVDAEGGGTNQRIAHPGIRANLTLVGRMTIAMVIRKRAATKLLK